MHFFIALAAQLLDNHIFSLHEPLYRELSFDAERDDGTDNHPQTTMEVNSLRRNDLKKAHLGRGAALQHGRSHFFAWSALSLAFSLSLSPFLPPCTHKPNYIVLFV